MSDNGVPATPSGCEATPSAADASSQSRIPNAVREILQLVPKAIYAEWGALPLEEPVQDWACVIDRFNEEARINQQCADQLQRKAEDAMKQARLHATRAEDYRTLANAFANAAVTFASGMSASGQDPLAGLEAKPASPTGEAGDAQ